jgi:hypothetical protein
MSKTSRIIIILFCLVILFCICVCGPSATEIHEAEQEADPAPKALATVDAGEIETGTRTLDTSEGE